MSDRIHWLTRAHYPDPLIDYSSTEFILEFQEAAQLLQQWRNPHLGRSSREGTVLSIASNAQAAYDSIQSKLLTTILDSEQEKDLIDKVKVYKFMLDYTLPEALELVNLDQLLTPEDIQNFIRQHIERMNKEYGYTISVAESIMNQLESITDIEITDEFGRKRRISRNDVLDVIGSVLGNMLVRQVSMWPVDNVINRPRGRLHLKKTYKSAIMREAKLPPTEIHTEDIKVIDKDRLALVYFIVDTSQSMSKIVYKEGLTRLDGALLTAMGLFYYFKLVNRRKRRDFDSFKMHIVPVTKEPYVISDNKKFENYLLGAEAKGKTRLVHAAYTAIRHVQENYQNIDYDVQLVFLTDGRPNVPFEGSLPGSGIITGMEDYFKNNPDTNTPQKAQNCMIQLSKLFNYLRRSRGRNWKISYFLMASKKFRGSTLWQDTQSMLTGVTRPILIDPTEVDSLGRRILQETFMNED
jgi:hypothetical protein